MQTIMKQLLLTLLLSGCWLLTTAQQPAQMSVESRPESTPEPEKETIELADSILQEATASGEMDYAVFGKYARDEEFYQSLIERFERADSILSYGELYTLYYGYVYRDGYSRDNELRPWRKSLDQEGPEVSYRQVCEALKKSPASAYILSDAFQLAVINERPEEEIIRIGTRLKYILNAIESTGDGTSKHPYVIASIPDEYVVLYNWLGIQEVKIQALTVSPSGKLCDQMEVTPSPKSEFQGTEVWFDISLPYPMSMQPGYWAEQYKATHEKD